MEKPTLSLEILQSETLRVEYVQDVIHWLAYQWDMNRALAEPTKNNNH